MNAVEKNCLEEYIQDLNHQQNKIKDKKNIKECHVSLEQRLLDAVPNISPESLLPVEISCNEDLGRFLVASKNILQGEIIFCEQPVVMTPKGGSGPVCLDCFKSLPNIDWSKCKQCKAPKCQPFCSGTFHTKKECQLLESVISNNPNKESDIGWIKLLNIILTPLRTYLVCKENAKINMIVKTLQSHSQIREETPIGKFVNKQIIPFFEKQIPSEDITEYFIKHVCGVFDTNAFEVTAKSQNTARALLPLGALMSHSCCPNSRHWFFEGRCVVRASVNIKQGEAITNSYSQSLWGTSTRRAHLRLTKLFICRCPRCVDPTELESYISSIKCHDCSNGLLVPPVEENQSWKCNCCIASASASSIKRILSITSGVVAMALSMDGEAIHKAIGKLGQMLGLRHSAAIELQFIFIKYIAKNILSVDKFYLHESLKSLTSLMNVADKLEHGWTNLRGVLLYHKLKITNEILRRNQNEDHNYEMEEEIQLKNIHIEGEECVNIMTWDPLSEEILQITEQLHKYYC